MCRVCVCVWSGCGECVVSVCVCVECVCVCVCVVSVCVDHLTSPCLKTSSSIREGRNATGINRNSDIRYTAAHNTPMASGLEGEWCTCVECCVDVWQAHTLFSELLLRSLPNSPALMKLSVIEPLPMSLSAMKYAPRPTHPLTHSDKYILTVFKDSRCLGSSK